MPADRLNRDAIIRDLNDALKDIDYSAVRKEEDGGVDAATERALDAAAPHFYALVQEPMYCEDPKAVEAILSAFDAFSKVDIAAYGGATGYTPAIVSAVVVNAPYGGALDTELAKRMPALMNGMSFPDRQQFQNDMLDMGVHKDAGSDGCVTAEVVRTAALPTTPRVKPEQGPRL